MYSPALGRLGLLPQETKEDSVRFDAVVMGRSASKAIKETRKQMAKGKAKA